MDKSKDDSSSFHMGRSGGRSGLIPFFLSSEPINCIVPYLRHRGHLVQSLMVTTIKIGTETNIITINIPLRISDDHF